MDNRAPASRQGELDHLRKASRTKSFKTDWLIYQPISIANTPPQASLYDISYKYIHIDISACPPHCSNGALPTRCLARESPAIHRTMFALNAGKFATLATNPRSSRAWRARRRRARALTRTTPNEPRTVLQRRSEPRSQAPQIDRSLIYRGATANSGRSVFIAPAHRWSSSSIARTPALISSLGLKAPSASMNFGKKGMGTVGESA